MKRGSCKKGVPKEYGVGFYPCSREATRDGFCWQHHPEAYKKRSREAVRRYEEKCKNLPWRKRLAACKDLLQRVVDPKRMESDEDLYAEIRDFLEPKK